MREKRQKIESSSFRFPGHRLTYSENEFVLQGYEYYENTFELDEYGKLVYLVQRSSTKEIKLKKIE